MHEIETMAYANAVPWHSIGTKVSDDISTDEMLIAAGLDWKVEPKPLFADMGDRRIRIPNKFALIRDKDAKIMSLISGGWKPVQNADILGFMRDYVKAGGAKLDTAGALREGRTIWSLAKLEHSFEASPGDRVNGYLLMTGSHEVGRATTIATTSVRVVCANTLAMAERSMSTHYRQNHLSEFDVSSAKQAVAAAHESLGRAEKIARQLVVLQLSADDAVRKAFAPVLLPNMDEEGVTEMLLDPSAMPRSLQEIMNSYALAPGASPGTGWGAMNAFTHWADHVAGNLPATRLNNAWFGANARDKLKVEAKLLELV